MAPVAATNYSSTTLDLLVRLRLAPEQSLRGVDLCGQLLKSPGYVSRVIDLAEGQGLVERRPDPNDRRAQQISLTPVGEEAVRDFVPHAIHVLDPTIYSVLDDDEVETLVDLLKRITNSAHLLLEEDRGPATEPQR